MTTTMPSRAGEASHHPLGDLHEIVARARAAAASERCDLCAVPIGAWHRHVVDIEERTLRCLCPPCHLLFSDPAAGGGRLRPVPDRYRRLSAVHIGTPDWDSLQIPVGLAFFFLSSPAERTVAFYPGPAGATESALPLDRWAQLVAANPDLAGAEPDVEAILLRRRPDATDCYLVPIDRCYELVGALRTSWVGFDGGSEARHQLSEFFARIEERCGA